MKAVFFDLGNTLEGSGVLLPGAMETLRRIASLRASDGSSVVLGLVSDFLMAAEPDEIPALQQQYYAILDQLGIRSFFEPVEQRVTLSTEVGVNKPDARIFRAAVDKVQLDGDFGSAMFITENQLHVEAARHLGMQAIHFRGPGQSTGEVGSLEALIPLVGAFVQET